MAGGQRVDAPYVPYKKLARARAEAGRGEKGEEREGWPRREEERWGMGIGRWRRGGGSGGCDGGSRGSGPFVSCQYGRGGEWGPGPPGACMLLLSVDPDRAIFFLYSNGTFSFSYFPILLAISLKFADVKRFF